MLKWLIPVAVVMTPFWLGIPLLYLGGLLESNEMQSYGFGILAIVPQIVQCPYSSYFKEGHFPHYWIASVAHWIVVFTVYGFLFRKRSLGVSLALFAGLMIGSIILAHVILKPAGYEFCLDSL